jgi:hypothetical protein
MSYVEMTNSIERNLALSDAMIEKGSETEETESVFLLGGENLKYRSEESFFLLSMWDYPVSVEHVGLASAVPALYASAYFGAKTPKSAGAKTPKSAA